MYLDINAEINIKMAKVDEVLLLRKGSRTLITMDSNPRSKAWHDNRTNSRGKTLKEFLTSK